MEVSDYIGAVASEGELFAAAAERGELGVDVSTCPGWDMRELVRHLGLIHLWAAGHVAFQPSDILDVDDLPERAEYWPDLAWGPADADLVSGQARLPLEGVQELLDQPFPRIGLSEEIAESAAKLAEGHV